MIWLWCNIHGDKKMCSFKCDWIYKLATVRMMCVNISGQFVCETTKTGIFDFHHRWSLSFTLIFSVKLRLCPVLLHSDVPDSRVGLLCCQVRPYKEAANLRVNRCVQNGSMINKALKSASIYKYFNIWTSGSESLLWVLHVYNLSFCSVQINLWKYETLHVVKRPPSSLQ